MSDFPQPEPSYAGNVGPEGFSEWTQKHPAPTPEMLGDPLWCVIWEAIKGWDIGCREYEGHTGALGNHARTIYDAIRGAELGRAERQVGMLRELCVSLRTQANATLEAATFKSSDEAALARAQARLQLTMADNIELNLDQTL